MILSNDLGPFRRLAACFPKVLLAAGLASALAWAGTVNFDDVDTRGGHLSLAPDRYLEHGIRFAQEVLVYDVCAVEPDWCDTFRNGRGTLPNAIDLSAASGRMELDMSFVLPGTEIPAVVNSFSALFIDREIGITKGVLQAFDPEGQLLTSLRVRTLEPGTSLLKLQEEGMARILLSVETDGEAIDNIEFEEPMTPPEIGFLAPAEGTVIPVGSNLPIVARATDTDGRITRVEFYSDDRLLGVVEDSPYELEWRRVPPGIHVLRATAVDDSGLSSSTPPLQVAAVRRPECAPEGRSLADWPRVPGAITDIYACVPDPMGMSIAPDGWIYAGRDHLGSGGTAIQAARIHRIAPGGDRVEEHGSEAISDPDVVLVDPGGEIAGTEGSVLVGGMLPGEKGLISNVHPDGTVEPLFGPSTLFANPSDFVLAATGEMLFTDLQRGALFSLQDGALTKLFDTPLPVDLEVDGLGQILLSHSGSLRDQITRHRRDNLGNWSEATFFADALGSSPLEMGSGGFWGTDLLVIDRVGRLVTLDLVGNPTVIGTGFISKAPPGKSDHPLRFKFGVDGRLFASDLWGDVIWVITPEELVQADLTLTGVDTSEVVWDPQDLAVAGEVSASVSNLGLQDAPGPFEVVFFEDVDLNRRYDPTQDNVIGQARLTEPLSAGVTTTVSSAVSGQVQFAGTVIWGFVDSQQVVPESDEENNLGDSAGTCRTPDGGSPLADLVVGHIRTEPQGSEVELIARIGNGGAAAVPGGIVVSFWDGDPSAGGSVVALADTSKPLSAGEHEDVRVVVSESTLCEIDLLWVSVDDADFTAGSVQGAVKECNESNNSWHLPPPSCNMPPTISEIPDGTTVEDTPAFRIDFEVNDERTDPDSLVVSATSSDQHLVPNAGIAVGGTGRNRTLTGRPAADAFGDLEIEVVVVDDGGLSALARFALTILPVNDPPSFSIVLDRIPLPVVRNIVFAGFAYDISAGPDNEAAQPLTFIIQGITNPEFFVETPAIDPNGTLTFTPSAHVQGTSEMTILLRDGGATANGGRNTSNPVSLAIELDTTVDLPDLLVSDLDATGAIWDLQDLGLSGQLTAKISNFGADRVQSPFDVLFFEDVNVDQRYDAGDNVVGRVSMETALLRGQTVEITAEVSGEVRFAETILWAMVDSEQAVGELNEANNLTSTGRDCQGSDEASGQLLPLADLVVSHIRTNVVGGDVELIARLGNAGAETAAAGLQATFWNADPTVGGSLVGVAASTRALAPGDYEDLLLTVSDSTLCAMESIWVRADDDGEGRNGQSSGQVEECREDNNTWHLPLPLCNQPPTVTEIASITLWEDGPARSIDFRVGDGQDDPSDLTISVNASDPELFPEAGLVLTGTGASRTLVLRPAPDRFGDATITVTAIDQGGLIARRPFEAEVLPVNDAPSFEPASDRIPVDHAEPVAVVAWARNLTAGPSNEAAQALFFPALANSSPRLFTAAPALASDGTLSFTAAPNVEGVAELTVLLRDDGGTANGGADSSAPFVLRIEVDTKPDLPDLAASDVDCSGLVWDRQDLGVTGSVSASVWNLGATEALAPFEVLFFEDLNLNAAYDAGVDNLLGRSEMLEPLASGQTSSVSVELSSQTAFSETAIWAWVDGGRTVAESDESNNLAHSGMGCEVADETLELFLPAADLVASHIRTNSHAGGVEFVVRVGNAGAAAATPGVVLAFRDHDPADGGVLLGTAATTRALRPGEYEDVSLTTSYAVFCPLKSIWVTVDDDGSAPAGETAGKLRECNEANNTWYQTLPSCNQSPTVSEIVDWVLLEDSPTVAILFAVDDGETAAADLAVSAVASNGRLVPPANLVLGGSDRQRRLAITPAPSEFGECVIAVRVDDEAGAVARATFLLTVLPVNDPPTFAVVTERMVVTSSAQTVFSEWAYDIAPGPANEAGQRVRFLAPENPRPDLFTVAPRVAPDGTLSFTAAPGVEGVAELLVVLEDNGGNADGGTNRSEPVRLTLVIDTRQDLPDLVVSDLDVDQLDWNCSSGTLSGTIVTSIANLGIGPTVTPFNVLFFEDLNLDGRYDEGQDNLVGQTEVESPFAPGHSASIATELSGTIEGVDTVVWAEVDGEQEVAESDEANNARRLPLAVCNQPPTITELGDQTVLEDAPVLVLEFQIRDDETPPTALTVSAVSSNPELFPASGLVLGGSGQTRTLSLNPAKDQFGEATIKVAVADAGGLAAQTAFRAEVLPVNDAPGFVSSVNRIDATNTGRTVVANWARSISAGPPNEADQQVRFSVTRNSNPSLFLVAPEVTASGDLSFSTPPNVEGTAELEIVLADSGGQENGGHNLSPGFALTFLIDTRPEVRYPVVLITEPANGAVFHSDNPILIEADAGDPDGVVTQVAFYADGELIGTDDTRLYGVDWQGAGLGVHTLVAIATDDQGLTTESASVEVLVGNGFVAVVGDPSGAELDRIETYLAQMGLATRTFDPTGLEPERLGPYDLIVFDDANEIGLVDATVDLLARSREVGKGLYLIGDRLTSSSTLDNLGGDAQAVWLSLLGLSEPRIEPGPINVTLKPKSGWHCVLNGPFGDVLPFEYAGGFAGGAVAAGSESYDDVPGLDMLVSHPRYAEVSNNPPVGPVFVQTLLVAGRGDDESEREREKLFKNVVNWLLGRCVDCTHLGLKMTVEIEEIEVGEARVPAGIPFEFRLTAEHTGGACEAAFVVASLPLPPGAEFVNCEPADTTVEVVGGTLVWQIRRLGQLERREFSGCLVVPAPGKWDMATEIRASNYPPESALTNHVALIVEGTALRLARGPGGTLQLELLGVEGQAYDLERSEDLEHWEPAPGLPEVTAGSGWVRAADLPAQPTGAVFLRARAR